MLIVQPLWRNNMLRAGISASIEDFEHNGITIKGAEPQKTVLITGATGQDGAVMSKLLLDSGFKVVGITRRTSSDNTSRLKELISHPNFTLQEGDITDLYSMYNAVDKVRPDWVLNFAAQSHVATSFEQPGLTWDVTASGAINVINAVKMVDKKIKIFQASTSEMFGDNFETFPDGSRIQTINTQLHPNSPYSAAKLAAHNYAKVMRDSEGMFICPVVLFNHTHTSRGDNFVEKKICNWVKKFREWSRKNDNNFTFTEETIIAGPKRGPIDFMLGAEILIPTEDLEFPKLRLGNINSYRDFGWAPDYMKAIKLIMEQDKPDDYLIATGKTYKISYILEYLLGPDYEKYIYIDPKFFRPKEVPYLCGVPSQNLLDLGWKPETAFETMLDRMVE